MKIHNWKKVGTILALISPVLTHLLEGQTRTAPSQPADRRLEADWTDIGYMLVAKTDICINKCLGGSPDNLFSFVSHEIGGYCCSRPNNSQC